MDICCSADPPYLPHVSAMLHSLLTHAKGGAVRIWLTHGVPLPEEGRNRVRQVVNDLGGELELVPIPPALVRGFSMKKFHPASWYRVVSPDLFPTLDRLLYLDADIIVRDDLQGLWETDLGDNLFAAVPNPLYPFMRNWPDKDLKLPDPRRYLNSGVLLMDLARMRGEGLVEKLRETSAANPHYRLPEQDALSDIARGRWLPLHARWNLQSILYEYPPGDLPPFDESEVREALDHPAVIHFCGWFKPWQYASHHPLGHLYFEHLRQTSWPVHPLEDDGLFYRLLTLLPLSAQFYSLLWRNELLQWLKPRARRLVRRLRR